MFRTFIAILVGAFAAMLVITGVELVGIKLHPPPTGLDMQDMAQVADFIAHLPMSAKAIIVGGWLLAALVGGFTTGMLAHMWQVPAGMVPGVLVAAGTVANALEIPHPTWMTATGAVGALLLGWLGARIGSRYSRPPPPEIKAWRGTDR